MEAHLLGTVLVDQPDQQGPKGHKTDEQQQHAQVGEYGPGLLVLRTHRLRAGVAGGSLTLLAARVGILLHRLSFRSGTRPPVRIQTTGAVMIAPRAASMYPPNE